MKKVILIAFSLLVVVACQTDDQYEDMNRDPKNPTQVDADFLFNSAVKSLFDQMTSTNVNLNVFKMLAQYFTETQYIDEANFDLNQRNIPQNHWSEMYRDVLLDLQTASQNVTDDAGLSAGEKSARIAQIEVLMVYTYQQLVDTYGNIPYTQSLDPVTYPLPAYDDAATIYGDLIARINAAIPNLKGSGFGTDNIYGGDMAKWAKFGNSVKLKLGIHLSDVDAATAKSTVESAVAGGVFTSNADNAILAYSSSTPNTNPLWNDLVESGRSDFVAANTIVDVMNPLNDPRRPYYFKQNLGPGVYKGGIYGDKNAFSDYTQLGELLYTPTFRGDILDYAEVSFYLAEAAARGFAVGGTVESHYAAGITASILDWGGTAGEATAYLANPAVAYATAAGDWKAKIGTQFWIAMYNKGFVGWTVWRRFDVPTLNIPVDQGKPVPFRYTYPVNEQQLNLTNLEDASTAIGGDEQGTKLFWDVN